MHHLEIVGDTRSKECPNSVENKVHHTQWKKNTQNILNLEKARVNVNVVDKLISQDGEILHNQESILNELSTFIRKFISKLGNLTKF